MTEERQGGLCDRGPLRAPRSHERRLLHGLWTPAGSRGHGQARSIQVDRPARRRRPRQVLGNKGRDGTRRGVARAAAGFAWLGRRSLPGSKTHSLAGERSVSAAAPRITTQRGMCRRAMRRCGSVRLQLSADPRSRGLARVARATASSGIAPCFERAS